MTIDDIVKDIVEGAVQVYPRDMSDAELKKHVRGKYKTLDDIDVNWALASALGVHKNRRCIARAVVELGYLSAVLPKGRSISTGKHLSRYVCADVVGKEQAEENLRRYVTSKYASIDDITLDGALIAAFGIITSIKSIVQTVLQRGYLSPVIPTSHSIGKGGGLSWYLCSDIVGEEQAYENLRRYVCDKHNTLDDIMQDAALASALGVDDNQRSIVRSVLERGYMSPVMPNGCSLGKGGALSWYVCADIVGVEQANENLRRYVVSKYATLDDIPKSHALSSAFGVECRQKNIVAAVIEREYMSADLPENHPISKGGTLSWYVNADVVGEEQAMKNLKDYIQTKYHKLTDIKSDVALSSVLGIDKRSYFSVRNRVAELGWL